jgi:hypothetical protein
MTDDKRNEGGNAPSGAVVMALAHALDPALEALDVVAHSPVQGEAMHKVIAHHAAQALVQVGWLGPYGLIPGGMDNDPAPFWEPVFAVRWSR